MKVTEVRGHHTTEMQSKRSRIREGITFCLGLALPAIVTIFGRSYMNYRQSTIYLVQMTCIPASG